LRKTVCRSLLFVFISTGFGLFATRKSIWAARRLCAGRQLLSFWATGRRKPLKIVEITFHFVGTGINSGIKQLFRLRLCFAEYFGRGATRTASLAFFIKAS